MVNYSIVMRRSKVGDSNSELQAYATAQYTDVMDINAFAEHIASHGCVYSRADIASVLTMAVDCMREQLLAGQRIELGDLGVFYISLRCKGAASAAEFNPEVHIKNALVRWKMGNRFTTLDDDIKYNLVGTRAAQAAMLRAIKAGETTVILPSGSSDTESETDSDTETGESTEDTGGEDDNTGNGSGESNPL